MKKTKPNTLYNKKDNFNIKNILSNQNGGAKKNKSKLDVEDSENELEDNSEESDDDSDDNDEDIPNVNVNLENDVEADNEDINSEIEDEDEEEDDDDNDDNLDNDDNIDPEETMGNKCLSKYSNFVLSDDEIEDYLPEDDGQLFIKNDRVSKNKLTYNERCALYCVRTKMLVMKAEPKIENSEGLEPKEIARLELKYRTMPLKIGRQIPNGNLEIWKLSELEYSDDD